MFLEANGHWRIWQFVICLKQTIVNDFPCRMTEKKNIQLVPSKLCNRTVFEGFNFKIKDRNRNEPGRTCLELKSKRLSKTEGNKYAIDNVTENNVQRFIKLHSDKKNNSDKNKCFLSLPSKTLKITSAK